MASLLLGSVRALKRDARSSHLRVIAAALIIAVAAMTAVGTFTDRIERALARQASALLAGDLAVTANAPLPAQYRAMALALGLEVTDWLSTRSMITAGTALQMIEIKAVTAGYPLRGDLLIANAPFGPAARARLPPAAGTVWVETRLLAALHAQVGDTVRIGAAKLRITALIVLEPDRAGDLFNLAPRVLMNLADVPATRLILPGSRVQYSLIVAGPSAQVARLRHQLPSADPGIRIIEPAAARPEVRSALTHARQFLTLAALVATTLAGLGILIAAEGFAREQVDAIAILRTLGASRAAIAKRYIGEVAVLGIVASAIGAGLGLALESGLSGLLSGWVQGGLPRASLAPAAFGVITGSIALSGFALPQLLALREVSPARVLRRDHLWQNTRPGVLVGGAVSALVLLAPWSSGDLAITAWSLAGFAGCLGALLLSAHGLLKLLRHWRPVRRGWKVGLANLVQRPGLARLQIAALGLSVMAILLLALVRTDLVASWTASAPPDAPDQFLINIQPEQVSALAHYLAQHQVQVAGFYSMVRGRLVEINGRAISPDDYPDARAKRLADREFNLSAATTLKTDNRIVAGSFWTPQSTTAQFSVDEDVARALDLKLGDSVTFQVAEQRVQAQVTSLREINWETMQANFFVLAPPATLRALPATFITSFKLPTGKFSILRNLSAQFPSVTVIDVVAILQQIRTIMDKALAAIQFVFSFTVAAGLLVVLAAIQATQAERLQSAAIMKTLGATRAQVLGITVAEFTVLGILAGVIGAIAATGAAWLIATRAVHVGFTLNIPFALIAIALALFVVLAAASYLIIRIWRQPVADIFREWY